MNFRRTVNRPAQSCCSTTQYTTGSAVRKSNARSTEGTIKLIAVLLLLLLVGYEQARPQTQNNCDGYNLVDKAGNIRKPTDFRDRYQAIGTYMVLNPNGNEMHVSYASPGTAEIYRKTGKFPDGAVLVKEVLGTDHAQMMTGDAHWASGSKVWFVMIKDEKGRYADNPLWGDGWGWALFNADAPDKQVATDYKKDCLGCHIPARGDGLGLRARVSGSRREVRTIARREPVLKMFQRRS